TTDPAGLKSTTAYDYADRPTDQYGPAPAAWFVTDRLLTNQQLSPGQYLLSTDGRAKFIFQTDGNLVLYTSTNGVLWSSNTLGAATQLIMQTDGNLVLYNGATPRWYTSTQGQNAS